MTGSIGLRLKTAVGIIVLLFTLSYSLGSPAQAISGDVVGTITDASGAVVPAASVTATNVGTGLKSTVIANDRGEYRFTNLPVGRYQVTASATGMMGELSGLEVTLNHTATANIALRLSSDQTSVEVVEQAPVLDATSAQISSTYESKQVQDLPAATVGLGVLNLSLLNAGVASSGGTGAGTGPSVGGQRPRNNNFSIEGVDNNSRSVTGPLVNVPNDAVQNFTVLQNVFSTEFGHSSGGQFNTVVQSGTNTFHGRAYEYFRNRNLNATDVAVVRTGNTENPRFDNNRFGGQVGGPIIRNKLFFFSNFEYNPIGQAALVGGGVCTPTANGYATLGSLPGVSAANLGVLRQFAAPAPARGGAGTACAGGSVNVAGTPVEVGVLPFVGPNFQNNLTTVDSVDWNISDRDQLRVRYIYNKSDLIDTAATLPSFYQPLPVRNHLFNLAEYHTFGTNLTNEFRIGFNRNAQTFPAGDFQFPGLDAFPNLTFDDLNLQLGPDPNAPQGGTQNVYQLTDNLTWVKGSHTIKGGVEFRHIISPQLFVQRSRGDYDYSRLDLFLRDVSPDVAGERSLGNATFYGNHSAFYWFVSDTWKVTPRFTLNFGVRHEYTGITEGERLQSLNAAASVPGLIEFDVPRSPKDAFAPRVGFAYSPGDSGKTVIRGGFGIAYDVFYDNIGILSLPPQLSGTVNLDLRAATPNFLGSGAIPPQNGVSTFPTIADQRAATATFIPVDRKLPYSESWELGVQRAFANSWTAEVRYVGTRGIHLNVQSRINRQAAVTGAADGLPTFFSAPSQTQLDALTLTLDQILARPTIVPAFDAAGFNGSNITAFEPFGSSTYHGLQAQLTRRFTRGLQVQAAYTWSHTIDNSTADVFSTFLTPRRPEDFQDFGRDRSTSALDRRHRVSISAVYDLPFFRNGSWFLKNVLGNWEFAPVYIYESPEYATVQSGSDANLNGDSAGDRAVFNPNGIAGTGSDVTALTNSAGAIVGYLALDPTAQFVRAGDGAFTNVGRNTLRTRPINNWDLTALKRVSLREKYTVEFQAQAFNLFNHPQFIPGILNQADSIATTGTDIRNFLIPGNPKFNHPEQVFNSNARTMQLGLKFIF